MRSKHTVPPGLACLGFILLTLAWIFGNPPGAAPDEPAHYVRAISVGRFHWLGRPSAETVMRAENRRQHEFLLSISRAVPVPTPLAAPDSWYCTVVDHDNAASCIDRPDLSAHPTEQVTYVGSYAPFAYVPLGLATRLGSNPRSALLWARSAGAVIALGFVLAAVWLVWDADTSTSLIGLGLAITPMVIFTASVLSTSAMEVASSLCLSAAVIRLWRDPVSRAGFYSAAVSAFVLGISRPLGPGWVLLHGLTLAVLLRREGMTLLASRARGPRLALVGLVLVGISANVAWQIVVLPPGPRPIADLLGFVGPSLLTLPAAVGEAIGFFGWQDVLMPRPAYALWGLAFVGLMASALTLGRRREVRRLETLLALTCVSAVAVSAVGLLPTGYTIRGRYILPALMPLSLVAGEIVHRHRTQMGVARNRIIVLGTALVAAVLQAVGWYSMAHRYAVGSAGPWLFLGHSSWEPPLGWGVWMGLVAAGAVCVVMAAVIGMAEGTRRAVP